MEPHNPRKIIGYGIGILFFGLIVVFGFNRFGRYLNGPYIEHINLDSYMETDNHTLAIEGRVRNTEKIFINQQNIILTNNNNFAYTVVIPSGHSIIDVDVYDTFGKHKQYQYMVTNTNIPKSYPSTYTQATETPQINDPIENLEETENEETLIN